MTDLYVIAFAAGFFGTLGGIVGSWAERRASDPEVERLERLLEDERNRVDDLLDRIQEPDIQTRHGLKAAEAYPTPPAKDWAYDPTGLVSVEIDPSDEPE